MLAFSAMIKGELGLASPRGARLALALLMSAYTLNFVDRQIVSVLAEPIKGDLGLSDTQLGMLGGPAFALFYTTLGIPVARLADRFNRVWIMTGALLLWSAATAFCGLAVGFGALFVARVGVGVGEAGGVAPAYSLIADLFPPRLRARATGVFSFGVPIGSALGIVMGGLVAARYGWRTAFLVAGAAGLVVAPLLRLLVREPVRGRFDPPWPPRPALSAVLRHLRRTPAFAFLALGAAMTSLVSYGLAFWGPSYFARSLHMGLVDRSIGLGGAALIGGIAGIWAGGVFADRARAGGPGAYGRVAAIGCALTAPAYALPTLAHQAWVALPLVALAVGLSLVWMGPVIAAVQELAPPTMRATAAAVYLLILNLIALGLGTPVVGWISDGLKARYGAEALRYAMLSVLPIYLVAAGLFWVAGRQLARSGWGETA